MADIFGDEEQAERIAKFWKEWGLALVIALAVVLAGVVGWRFFQDFQTQRADDLANLYFRLELAEETGNDEQVDLFVAQLEEQYPQSSYRVDRLLAQVKEIIEADGDYELALTTLQEALRIANDSIIQDTIRIRIARVQWQLDRSDDALATLAKVSEGYKPFVLELTGDIHRAREEYPLAQTAYENAYIETFTRSDRERIDLKIALLPKKSEEN